MKLSRILQRFVPFIAALALGLAAVLFLKNDPQPPSAPSAKNEHAGVGSGHGYDFKAPVAPPVAEAPRTLTQPLKITSKPKAAYTDIARAEEVQGTVRLKVTLLANGEVGSVTVVNSLPRGLTEQAIAAARKIRFEPAMVNGVAVSKTITIDYSFTIY